MPPQRRKRSAPKRTARRRTTVRQRAAPKKRRATSVRRRTTTALTSKGEIAKHLTVYHDPFSMATKQPKIPDSKLTESLGFTTRAVDEIRAGDGSDGILHMFLVGGQNAGIHILNEARFVDDPAFTSDRVFTIPYISSNNIDINSLTVSGGNVTTLDDYARWRLVSQGLKLTLLNVDDEDDGWWEACRVTEPIDTSEWYLQPGANGTSTTGAVLTPGGLVTSFASRNIVNDRSYCTGSLRKIHEHKFELHPIGDDHDVRPQFTTSAFGGGDIDNAESLPLESVFQFTEGSIKALEFIESKVDWSFDMIYIRIRGRVSTTGETRSKLHMNLVSNQEIVYGTGEREARWHTTSPNHPKMDAEINNRKGAVPAAVPSEHFSGP